MKEFLKSSKWNIIVINTSMIRELMKSVVKNNSSSIVEGSMSIVSLLKRKLTCVTRNFMNLMKELAKSQYPKWQVNISSKIILYKMKSWKHMLITPLHMTRNKVWKFHVHCYYMSLLWKGTGICCYVSENLNVLEDFLLSTLWRH